VLFDCLRWFYSWLIDSPRRVDSACFRLSFEPLVFNIWFYLCVFYAAVVVSVDLFSDLL